MPDLVHTPLEEEDSTTTDIRPETRTRVPGTTLQGSRPSEDRAPLLANTYPSTMRNGDKTTPLTIMIVFNVIPTKSYVKPGSSVPPCLVGRSGVPKLAFTPSPGLESIGEPEKWMLPS